MEGLAVYRSSIYLGPGVNLVHLVSMCTFMGALLMVDLRLLGAGLTTQPVRSVARSAQPWLIGGFIGLVVTGIPAMMATATMQYASKVFWFKMYVLAAALLLTFTVRWKLTRQEDSIRNQPLAKAVALLSIVLWMTVAAGGRLIMYL